MPAITIPPAPSTPAPPSPRPLRAMAWIALALMATVVVASAWLRLAQPRPPCIDWPACRTAAAQPAPADAAAAPMPAVRGIHRVAATALLLVVVAALVAARRGASRVAQRIAAAMLALALALSVLGVVTPGSRSAAVMLGNLLGGLLLLALAWCFVRALQPPAAQPRTAARAATIAALSWLAQAALGALAGGGHVAVAPQLHLLLAVVGAPAALFAGRAALGAGRASEGRAVIVLAVAQVLAGLAAAWADATPALVLLHNAGAAAGFALLAGLAVVDVAQAPAAGSR